MEEEVEVGAIGILEVVDMVALVGDMVLAGDMGEDVLDDN